MYIESNKLDEIITETKELIQKNFDLKTQIRNLDAYIKKLQDQNKQLMQEKAQMRKCQNCKYAEIVENGENAYFEIDCVKFPIFPNECLENEIYEWKLKEDTL